MTAAHTFDDALSAAATELNLPSTHSRVDRLATLQFAYLSARQRWATDQTPDSMKVMFDAMERVDAFRKDCGANEPLQISVNIVESAKGIGFVTCSACGHRERHEFDPGALEPLPPKPVEPEPIAIAAPPPAPAKDTNVVEIGARLHYGSEGAGMGAVYAPAATNRTADLWRNDQNPLRGY